MLRPLHYFIFVGLLAVSLLFKSSLAFAVDQKICQRNMARALNSHNATMALEYQKLANETIRPQNETRFQIGSSTKVAILMHGYAGSPFEVQSLADYYHDRGYTTIEPLIWGFGSSAKLANSSTSDQWEESLQTAIDFAAPCASEISLVGFSMGGTIVSDFVLNRVSPEGIYENAKGEKIKIASIILLSPFFELRRNFPLTLFSLLQSLKRSVDLANLYHKTKFSDLKAMAEHTQFYNSRLPLTAGRNISAFAGKLLAQPNFKSQIPLLLSFSEHDATINTKAAIDFVDAHFSTNQKYIFGDELKVPHQLLLTDFNPALSQFFEKVGRFLAQTLIGVQ